MTVQNTVYAPGARVVIRDAEWIIRRVDTKSNSGYQLTCIGLSELVKDKEAIFLSDLEKKIEILDPAETDLVHDTSSGYNSSILYIESVLRQIAPTDEKIYIGHKAAMDLVPYQLDPAIMSLQQPRQRILISDAVGLGKTLEAGILVSELIKRGKGKRILVLAIKSMLTQFQKEFWSRFTVPLTRLDSIGLQRVKNKIPTNHNPFYYYDKAIISIDTLKQDSIYREHLKNAYWDIIIIDEAHNVADRGSGALRNKLAKLISGRSDTLIMLSATPHDGRARSFASLMNMLNPTAIANPDEYTKDEIKGLFIRRFKKDIQDQVRSAFKEREIFKINVDVSAEEENVFELFVNTKFVQIDNKAHAGQLFKTTLEKSLFSSPAACLQTVRNRIKKLQEFNDSNYNKDIESLIILEQELGKINANNFNKYQKLLQTIKDKEKGFGWTGKDKTDRLVIFTERIETVNFLAENLSRDLKLTENQLEKLHGSLSDVEQQKIVEDFGKEESPLRLLIASDVASEGINLHYLSHRMIHFDIPWSLMVFQQRNGRIDRYGQEKTPQIYYLVAQSKNEKIKGDMRILEVLIDKDDQAAKNINDPSAFFKVKDINEQEILTAKAIEQSNTSDQFNSSLDEDISLLDLLMEEVEKPVNTSFNLTTSNSSLFVDDFSYLQKALEFQGKDIQTYIDPAQ
jgi:SNF2 family DNA or RNA helicase